MTDLELSEILQNWKLGKIQFSEMFAAVHTYRSADNDGNVLVSRSAVADFVKEAETRVTKAILMDVDFGYDAEMIGNKIKAGSYVESSLETYRSYKRHFC